MNALHSLLLVSAVVAGLAELAMAVQFATSGDPDDVWPPAAILGVAFIALAAFARTGRAWPVIGLAILFALELAFVPFLSHDSLAEWVTQGGFAFVSLFGIVAAVGVLVARRRAVA